MPHQEHPPIVTESLICYETSALTMHRLCFAATPGFSSTPPSWPTASGGAGNSREPLPHAVGSPQASPPPASSAALLEMPPKCHFFTLPNSTYCSLTICPCVGRGGLWRSGPCLQEPQSRQDLPQIPLQRSPRIIYLVTDHLHFAAPELPKSASKNVAGDRHCMDTLSKPFKCI